MNRTMEPVASVLRVVDVYASKALSVCSSRSSLLGFLRPIFLNIELMGHGGIWLFFVPMLFLLAGSPDTKEKLFNLEMALIIDMLVVCILKGIFKRPRPENNLNDQGYLLSDVYSMPSGHSSRVILIYMFLLYNFNLSTFWIEATKIWALLVIISRLTMARHYILDVIAGSVLGYLEAYIVTPNILWVKFETIMSLIPWKL